MNNYIRIEDYDASIHAEILDRITRSDSAVIEVCEDRAVAEMRGYLGGRYDCDRIFSAEGDERHPLVLMMAIDIAVYHLCCIHNPRTVSDIRRERYERAVEWLKAVAAQQVSIDGAPRLPEEAIHKKAKWKFSSNRKRVQHL